MNPGLKDQPKKTLCPRCDLFNLEGALTCQKCGGDLFLICRGCGHKNRLSRDRCSVCRKRLTSLAAHVGRKVFHSFAQLSPGIILMFLLCLIMIFGVIWFVNEVGAPQLDFSAGQ